MAAAGLAVAVFAAWQPAPAQAQLGSLLGTGSQGASGTESRQQLIESIATAAEEGGLTVIVVDGQGQVLSGEGLVDGAPGAAESTMPGEGQSTLMRVQTELDAFRTTLAERFAILPVSINEVAYVLRFTSPEGRIGTYVEVLGWTVALLLLGRFLAITIYARTALRKFVTSRIRYQPEGYREKLPFLVVRFCAGVSVTVVSMIIAYVIGYAIWGEVDDVSVEFTIAAIMTAYFLTGLVADFWRMLLSPYLPQYRMPALDDRAAKRLYFWARALAIYSIWSLLFATWVRDFGLNYNVYAILYGALELVGALGNVAMVVFNASAISRAIRGGRAPEECSWMLRSVSRYWAPALVLYFAIGWRDLLADLVLEREIGMPMIAGLYIVVMSALTAYAILNFWIEIYFERSRRMRERMERIAAAAEREDAIESVPGEVSEAPARPASRAAAAAAEPAGPAESAEPVSRTPASGEGADDTRGTESNGAAADAAPGDDGKEADSMPRRPVGYASGDEPDSDSDDSGDDGGEESGGGPRPVGPGEGARGSTDMRDLMPRPAISTYEELAHRVSGIIAFCVGVFAIIEIWDPALLTGGDTTLDNALDVLVIIFLGYIAYSIVRIWMDNKIAEETEDMAEVEPGDEGGGASGASRLATLLPLFRGAVLAVVVVTIGLIALMELGVNVSPLFAGAGVVGLAVGFGAQTLVRDIFSGAFFLVDDAFRKGEYIDIGDVKGTVERISVRSMQLRHHLGALNTIPFGEIQVLTNYSRDWVIMKLPLRVTYDTDVERVRKLIKNLGKDLQKDPVIGENFIQPLKSQGVIEMQDSAMIIRVKFMTKPGDQWVIRKRVYQEIRELFAREGVKFAHREVTVRLAEGQNPDGLTPDQKEAVAGAVQTAIEEGKIDVEGGLGDKR